VSSQVTGIASEDGTSGEFGANEWLVDEMYERFTVDRNSVDKSWWAILENYQPTNAATAGSQPPEPQAPKQTAVPQQPETASATPSATTASDKADPAPSQQPQIPREVMSEAPAQPTEPAASTPPQPVAKTTSVQAKPQPIPADAPSSAQQQTGLDAAAPAESQDTVTPLRGMAKSLATNMDASLSVPTATSVRTIPAKLMIDNRIVINNHMKRARGGKISFTHLIAWAMVQALKEFPSQNVYYDEVNGKPSLVAPPHVNLGIAIDMPKPDGTRALLVPGIKRADTMGFGEFLTAYEDVVKRARTNKLTAGDFQGNTISLTNPGGIGTVHSVPRLMKGAGCIIGAGALEYPAEFQGMSPTTQSDLGIGKTITLTSTYDHRVIQGVPEEGPRAAPRTTGVLRRNLRRPSHSLRAHPLGIGHPRRPGKRRRQDCSRAGFDQLIPRSRTSHGRRRPAGVRAAFTPRP
jgi:2-oxoglutarate decarboxylase